MSVSLSHVMPPAVVGVAGVEAVGQLLAGVSPTVQIVVQVVIGIVTLIRLLKKEKKDEKKTKE